MSFRLVLPEVRLGTISSMSLGILVEIFTKTFEQKCEYKTSERTVNKSHLSDDTLLSHVGNANYFDIGSNYSYSSNEVA